LPNWRSGSCSDSRTSSRKPRAISAPSNRTPRSRWTRWAASYQLRDEKDQRADSDKEIERTLRDQTQALEKRIRSLSDQLSQLDRDMSDRLTRESQSLREEIKQKNADLVQTIEKMFAELSGVKTDRTLLASLFVEVAKCLNQDLGSKSMVKGGGEPLRGLSASKLAT
jgi:hypothetical protein